MGAKVENLALAIRGIRKDKDTVGKVFADYLEKAANTILKISKKLVPVDIGNLKDSGKVVRKGEYFRTVVYVVYEAFYAVWVHENLEAYHKPPTQAKYLSDAVKLARGTVNNMLKKQVSVLSTARKRGGV